MTAARRRLGPIAGASAAAALAALVGGCRSAPAADPLARLAHQLPATVEVVVALDGRALRGTWVADSGRALHALVAPDRECVVDAALAADRALLGELARGRLVVLAVAAPPTCPALSQVARGVWIATLDAATAPGPREPRLDERPDWPALAAALRGPLAGVAPDGAPDLGVVYATADLVDAAGGRLALELDSPERAADAERWIAAQLAAGAPVVGEHVELLHAARVHRDGVTVTATLATDPATAASVGPVAIVAATGALAARRRAPPAPAPTCASTRWSITCEDDTHYTAAASLRATVEGAVRAAPPAPRTVGGQPAGVRFAAIAPDSVLYALGLRSGDAIIAIDDRRLDTRAAAEAAVAHLRAARRFSLTVERDDRCFALEYTVR